MRHPLTTLLLACLLPAPAFAQTIVPKLDQDGRRGEIARIVHAKAVKQFDEADKDKDGRLTREEVTTVSPFKGQAFAQFDKNEDGFLDWEEFVGHDRWAK